MTLPDERYRALKQGKKLLEELCDPGKTPRVPSIVRDRARQARRRRPRTTGTRPPTALRCPHRS